MLKRHLVAEVIIQYKIHKKLVFLVTFYKIEFLTENSEDVNTISAYVGLIIRHSSMIIWLQTTL